MDSLEYVAEVNSRIEEALTKADRSKAWLARKTWISLTTINRKLAGDPSGFTVAQLHAIAGALDIEVLDLVPNSARRIAS